MPNTTNAAILGKARAMYGRRLRRSDWENLLGCATVADAAAYLKANTDYRGVLANAGEGDIHRGELEDLLRQRLVQEAAKLGRYDAGLGAHISNYLIGRLEIGRILQAVMRVDAHETHAGVEPNPYLAKLTPIDERAIDNAETFDELLEAVKGTRYYKLMRPFRPADGDFNDYTGLENALYIDLYRRLYAMLAHMPSRGERQELRAVFDDVVDLENYARIIRLKTYYHVNEAQVRACLLPFGSLSSDKLAAMAAAETPDQVTTIMRSTGIGKRALPLPCRSVDELKEMVRYSDARHDMHFSAHPSVILISYVFLMQAELTALIHLIEGIRYQVPRAQIQQMLIPYETMG